MLTPRLICPFSSFEHRHKYSLVLRVQTKMDLQSQTTQLTPSQDFTVFWSDEQIPAEVEQHFRTETIKSMTTRFIDQETLVGKISQHLGFKLPEWAHDRVYCHRFGTRHLTSGAFVDIVSRYIEEAQKKLFDASEMSGELFRLNNDKPSRRSKSDRIRLVLEDWNNLLSTYPNLRNESLLLSTILALFRTEGITALFVSTQSGQPGAIAGSEAHELRNLDESQILTWSVPFYGDRRVAITANGGVSAPIICELRTTTNTKGQSSDEELLQVSRHFDLYADVDLGNNERQPMEVSDKLVVDFASGLGWTELGKFYVKSPEKWYIEFRDELSRDEPYELSFKISRVIERRRIGYRCIVLAMKYELVCGRFALPLTSDSKQNARISRLTSDFLHRSNYTDTKKRLRLVKKFPFVTALAQYTREINFPPELPLTPDFVASFGRKNLSIAQTIPDLVLQRCES